MRRQSQKCVIAIAFFLSIAFCLSSIATEARSVVGGEESRTGTPQKAAKSQPEAPKYDRIVPKYKNGKYVGDKYYKDGKLVKETTFEYHANSDKAETETVIEYDPDSTGEYKTREEETTNRPDGSTRSKTVTEYGSVNNPLKRSTKESLSDGGTLDIDTTYDEGGSSTDAERRIKTEDRVQKDKHKRPVVIEHTEWTNPLDGPKGIKSGYRQTFEYPDKDAREPSKQKDQHYEVGKDGKGEWKPGLLPPPKSASKPAKAGPAPPGKPQPKPSQQKPLKSVTTMRTIGIVRPANSRPGERAVISVVADPERYESIPGLKVTRREIPTPEGATGPGWLADIVVDTGDGHLQSADNPVEITIAKTSSFPSISLRRRNDSTLLTRIDSEPVADDGLGESPELDPAAARVRKAREEAYRRAIRRKAESGQEVDEAREAEKSEEDVKRKAEKSEELARVRRRDQRNKDVADEAAKNVPPEGRRAIEKEEADVYRRAAEEESKKAQEERNKVGPDRQKQDDQSLLPIDQNEARARANEAERKANDHEKNARRNRERARALDPEAEKSKTTDDRPAKGDATSYWMPPLVRDIGVNVINGPFHGTAIEDNVMIDGRMDSAFVVAKSLRSLFYRLKEDIPAGMHRVTLREDDGEVDFPLCVLHLTMSADQLNLLRAQSTRFRAIISGPEQLPPSAWERASVPAELVDVTHLAKVAPDFRLPSATEKGSMLFTIENKSRDTVTLGRDVVVLKLAQQDFRNGPYRHEGDIKSLRAGSFTIEGTVTAYLAPLTGESSGARPGNPIAGPASKVPQDPDAKKCDWKRYNLGKDAHVTKVTSDKPTIVEVRIANLAASGGFEYHCLQSSGTALIIYKYTDVNGPNQEGRLRVFCN